MYAGHNGGGELSGAGRRISFDAQQVYQGYRPSSRSGTPRLEGAGAAGMYPTYDPSQAPVTSPDAESIYEERDLGQMYDGGVTPGTSHPWMMNGGAGPSSPRPPRSSYGSPSPFQHQSKRTSLEVGHFYSPHRSYAPSSAPPDYPLYANDQGYFAGASFPGAFPGAHGPYSEPAADEYYWYAGAPPSAASSNTMHGGPHRQNLSSRASAPAGTYDHSSHAGYPGFFGIRAPHHFPGHRHPDPRQAAAENLPNFPQWSRTWYDGHLSANGHAYTAVAPASGESGWESETLTRSGGGEMGPYGRIYGVRGRDADFVKEERIRMLERQFGKPKISHKGEGGDDEEGEDEEDQRDDDEVADADLPLGSVNSRGKMIVERPRLRFALRWLIGITALACVATGIGGALLIKPGQDAPASRGSIASYIVYVSSVITLLIILYLYVFRPCCCDPMRKDIKTGGQTNPFGGMVIPVLSSGGPGGKPGKGKGFGMGKKKAMMMQQQAPTVNLIVDPTLLGVGGGGGGRKGRKGYDDDDDDDEEDERLPGDARRSSRRKNGLGVLGNMQMQRRWMIARKRVKLFTIWDSILCVAWIACSIVALGLGKSCPAGGGNGWCNYYNGAIACGVILAVLFLIAIYFDYRDLKVSQKPPKPPM